VWPPQADVADAGVGAPHAAVGREDVANEARVVLTERGTVEGAEVGLGARRLLADLRLAGGSRWDGSVPEEVVPGPADPVVRSRHSTALLDKVTAAERSPCRHGCVRSGIEGALPVIRGCAERSGRDRVLPAIGWVVVHAVCGSADGSRGNETGYEAGSQKSTKGSSQTPHSGGRDLVDQPLAPSVVGVG